MLGHFAVWQTSCISVRKSGKQLFSFLGDTCYSCVLTGCCRIENNLAKYFLHLRFSALGALNPLGISLMTFHWNYLCGCSISYSWNNFISTHWKCIKMERLEPLSWWSLHDDVAWIRWHSILTIQLVIALITYDFFDYKTDRLVTSEGTDIKQSNAGSLFINADCKSGRFLSNAIFPTLHFS